MEYLTCAKDVKEICRYEVSDDECCCRGCQIIKVLIRRTKGSKEWDWIYMLLLDDDKYPVPLSDELALKFIENPEEAKKYAFCIWMDRYR